MFSYPFDYYYEYYRNDAMKSFMRLLHSAPKCPAIDIYINDKPWVTNIKYKDFSEYLPIRSGNYNVKVYAAGKKINPFIDTSLFIPPNEIYTIAIIGKTPDNLSILPIKEPLLETKEGKLGLRFAQLSPNAPNVDVVLPNGDVLFKDVAFKDIKDYIEVPSGIYTVEIRLTGTDTVILYVPNIHLKPKRFYTIYSVGLVGGIPPLQVLIPLDGNSYIEF
ncbi:hypothetical protein CLTEP_15890 [Clostridium tepidiprofundi DSM 19306]|uniref:DUF4397 domain-containing protein n=1 Tax=Clostridium tepidiprofundi DSM 19306 TaxID=1121338 RepID=A0A151B457_9CLOT|nr:DUF4397 domain-containing protein [Clostridium tepidiprofundi]KYH34437.1 hypothetical protein CLTEP_15890 [Clostridium tepidiprofundi DSM 19306]